MNIDLITFRIANFTDSTDMSNFNIKNSLENYPIYYWTYNLLFYSNSFLAFHNNNLIGYIFSFPTSTEIHLQTATICSLVVDYNYRNIGIASNLLDLCKTSYTTIPIKIYLHVNIVNENAIKLYKKKGYRVSKLIPEYYTKTNTNINTNTDTDIGTITYTDAYQMFTFKNFI